MHYFAIVTTFAMIAISVEGCFSSQLIYPQERVVVESEKTDFGFIGTWRQIPTPDRPDDDSVQDISISMNADGVYTVEGKGSQDYTTTLRATELSKDSGYAIVDVDIVADEKHYCRSLVLAKRKDDVLYVWLIQSKNIASKLHESGHSGVIEHGTFSTRVYAKPADLLDCIRKHSKDLVDEPMSFKLVGK